MAAAVRFAPVHEPTDRRRHFIARPFMEGVRGWSHADTGIAVEQRIVHPDRQRLAHAWLQASVLDESLDQQRHRQRDSQAAGGRLVHQVIGFVHRGHSGLRVRAGRGQPLLPCAAWLPDAEQAVRGDLGGAGRRRTTIGQPRRSDRHRRQLDQGFDALGAVRADSAPDRQVRSPAAQDLLIACDDEFDLDLVPLPQGGQPRHQPADRQRVRGGDPQGPVAPRFANGQRGAPDRIECRLDLLAVGLSRRRQHDHRAGPIEQGDAQKALQHLDAAGKGRGAQRKRCRRRAETGRARCDQKGLGGIERRGLTQHGLLRLLPGLAKSRLSQSCDIAGTSLQPIGKLR